MPQDSIVNVALIVHKWNWMDTG